MLITWAWVLVGLAGVAVGTLVLRENLADWQAAKTRPPSELARMILKETLRTTVFGLLALGGLTTAGVPSLLPSPRPTWIRLFIIGCLIGGETLLVLDMLLRLRAKRRLLTHLRRDRKAPS